MSAAAWHCFPLTVQQTTTGHHRIEVTLLNRHPQLACDLVLTDIELVIHYRHDDNRVTAAMDRVIDEVGTEIDDFTREAAHQALRRAEW